MSKKILSVSVCIVLLSLIFVACGKDKNEPVPDDTTTSIEYTTDTDGNTYVTNINGELIPVTTGKDGSVEFIDDLVTKTKAQADKEKEEMDKDKEEEKNPGDGGNGGNNNEDNTTTTKKSDGIIIGDDDVGKNDSHDAVIDWGA